MPAITIVGSSEIVQLSNEVRNIELELTSTSQTQVCSFTPLLTGMFIINVFIRVAAATTALTLSVSWTDASGTAQSYVWENGTNIEVGNRLELPVIVIAQAGSPITVYATAGTANQVYVSANISQM